MNNASVETRQQRRFRGRQEKKGIAVPVKNAFYRAMGMAKQVTEALSAAMNLGPVAMKLAMMDLAFRLGNYKSRGKGRGTPARNYLRPYSTAWRDRGTKVQESLRQMLGGWALNKRLTGLTKNQFLDKMRTAEGRIELRRLAETLRMQHALAVA